VGRQKPREIAVLVLLRQGGEDFIEDILDAELGQSLMSPVDRHLCQELVYGVVRWQATLDWLISRKTHSNPRTALLRAILHLGLYQLLWLDRIPDHAAVYETVQLARRHGLGVQSGFVNGVLRSCLRERDILRRQLSELKTKEPHLGYSHPEWLVERWTERWGANSTNQLLDWNNQPPPTYARVNSLKVQPDQLIEAWGREVVDFVPANFEWAPNLSIFELRKHPPLAQMPSFRQGLFYVQDPSTLLAPTLLGAMPGEAVLDLCAAPGGKLTLIAQQMGNKGRLCASDVHPDRFALIRQNCARLGVSSVDFLTPVALQRHTFSVFDRVLVDAPCSNTGVMRRRVDLRWRLRPEEIARLEGVQVGLLRKAAALVRPGGTLVYSTCSLEPEENQNAVKLFLQTQPGHRLVEERDLAPFRDGVDGAYVAKIIRTDLKAT
jgi:16S rRNA (cytosine967-C5)-methyltransferase